MGDSGIQSLPEYEMHNLFAQSLCIGIMHTVTASKRRTPESGVRLDAAQVRALAHPLRSRLLAMLRIDGPATATTLARALGTNTGATSYHLRALAETGLVVEEPDRGTTRQRWWRSAHEMHQFMLSDFAGDPDSTAAARWLEGQHVRLAAEWAEKWDAARSAYPADWQDAAVRADNLLTLAPDRLRALAAELHDVIMRYREEPVAPGADARQVYLFLSAHPLVPQDPQS
jgi:DNA-binding transcriptional ArsR family regulator